ncbi:MAG: GntR family transcriptional regulator [Ilumatobacteraceae bacterium]
MRSIRYHDIAQTLRARIVEGDLASGRLLQSESELSKEFTVSRVTIRRALEVLRDEGLIAARQGFGWFVTGDPVSQPLGRLGTIEEQLTQRGVKSERRIIDFGFEKATKRIAKILDCDQVLRVKRVNMADDEPFAVVTVWCPYELGKKLSRAQVESSSFYNLIDRELGGATQTIGADLATTEEAKLLEIPAGSPVLSCDRITTDVNGKAVLVSHHVFPAMRTNFVVNLPSVPPSIAPTGLRLVD